MASGTIGRNIVFPIFNADGTSFHNLVLKRAVVDSVVMSLSDKITGDVYYPDNTLRVTMQEYIEYKRDPQDADEQPVRYYLVNPPTIVREGMASDNGEAKGMTKYSLEFYHPMYMLANFPFTDVATTSDQTRYLSQNKTFSWIGTPQDFIDKLNKNLDGTQWVVAKSERFPIEKDDVLSEVHSFDKNTIADALKFGYETWEIPFVISQINEGEQYYSSGKRFLIEYGLPSNEIYENETKRLLDEPFVFQFGQGVGLKNNSRTPRNNKIVTRISGSGSSDNIPYGYPQIRWYGNANWKYTIGDDPDDPDSYPIYDGIVGGEVVRLIKHPFTRDHLMPSVYSETLFNKVSPYLPDGTANPDYDPDADIIDYYDAVATQDYPYVNEINPSAPSYEIHEFEDIKPELDSEGTLAITAAVPLNNDLTQAEQWDDTMDDDGNFNQSYFQVTLPVLAFDLYACAAITQEMQINMRSGACIGCTFPIQVDWDNYKANFYDTDGNFAPNGSQRDYMKYPDSSQGAISIVLQKENSTFGTLMPNVYQKPASGDTFVILGISLPLSYITDAEERLDDAMKSYMLENNVYYYDYPLKFDEHFLATHTNILKQLHPNSIVRFMFGEETLALYVKQMTIKYENKPLPTYDITLTDDVEVVLNQIGQVADDVEKLGSLISALRQNYNRSAWVELAKKLSKVDDDIARGLIASLKGFQVGTSFASGASGQGGRFWIDPQNNSHLETDFLYVRKKLQALEVEIEKMSHIGGSLILSAARCTLSRVEIDNGYATCYWPAEDDEGNVVTNDWKAGDQARVQTFNLITDTTTQTTANHYWWRLVNDAGTINNEHYLVFDIRDTDSSLFDQNSEIPMAGDEVVLCGSRATIGNSQTPDLTRQNVIILDSAGAGSPYIRIYNKVNTFSLGTARIDLNAVDPKLDVSSLTITANGGATKDIGEVIDESFLVWYVTSDAPTENGEILSEVQVDYPTFPAAVNNWSSVNYPTHKGDVALTTDGVCYRLEEHEGTYSWKRKADDFLIDALQTATNNAKSLANMASDNIITAQEKQQLKNLRTQIMSEKEQVTNEADGLTATYSYVSAYNALKAFLDYFLNESGDTYLVRPSDGKVLYAFASVQLNTNVLAYSVDYATQQQMMYAGKQYSRAISDYYNTYNALRRAITMAVRNEIQSSSETGYDAEVNAYVRLLSQHLTISDYEGTVSLVEFNDLYNAISSWEWQTINGVKTVKNGAGLVTTTNFASLFSSAWLDDEQVASAIVSAFCEQATDSQGNPIYDSHGDPIWVSNVGINATYFIVDTQNFKVTREGDVTVSGNVSAKNFVNEFVTLPKLYDYVSESGSFNSQTYIDLLLLLKGEYYYKDGNEYKLFKVGSSRNFVVKEELHISMTHSEEMLEYCPNGTRVLFVNQAVLVADNAYTSGDVLIFTNDDGVNYIPFIGVSMEYMPHTTYEPVVVGKFTPVRKISVGNGLIEFVSIPDSNDECDWVVTRISSASYEFKQNIH